jgi:membrane-bound lytic murein transglycosylase B
MSAARNGRLRKATALVPLAVLSVAWTVSVAGVGGTVVSAVTSAPTPAPALPDGTSVPSQAIRAPASVTGDEGSLSTAGGATQIISTASTSGIPSAALAAYQRAETVINAADPTCKLPWQLVAAIGRVESNHGRANGNVLDDSGVAAPGIYGPALDGTKSTALISDTDAGQYDADTSFDRAVGPMQFIPSTWSVVGVDADGDGVRNPQDVDDSALGTAVYLCSGEDDLSTPAGRQAAVFRYNHSQSYVDLVLSVMQAYTAGDFTTVPNSAVAAGQLFEASKPITGGKTKNPAGTKTTIETTSDPVVPTTPAAPTATPTTPPAPPATDRPSDKPTGGSGNGSSDLPTGIPAVPLPALPSTSIAPVDQVLTLTQAILQCTLNGLIDNPTQGGDKFDVCVKNYTGS